MTLWFGILLLTIGAAALALRPLLRAPRAQSSLEHAVAFYEARREELARQAQAGLISNSERIATEAEHARRLLALEKQNLAASEIPALSDGKQQVRRRKIAAMLVLVGLPLIALPLYAIVGRPAVPDQPLAGRVSDPQTLQVADALQKIEQHLARNPEDLRGFEVVAPVYLRAGRFDDAAFAFRRIIALAGETPERLADLGEALLASANGVVNAEAKASFSRALVLDPNFPKARFYLAIATEQDGNTAEAVTRLTDLSRDLPSGAARERVEAELDRFRAEGKAPPRPAASQGPASEAGQMLAALPADERAKAIESMVEGLSERLMAGNGTLDEWRRLLQARIVLGQKDKAREALAAARRSLANDPAALLSLDQIAAGNALFAEEPKP